MQSWSLGRRRAFVLRFLVSGLAGVLGLSACVSGAATMPAQADTKPLSSTVPATVSSDPLPTAQINGVAWTQLIVGTTVYVGGDFGTARPAGAAAGSRTVPRANFLAYNLATGIMTTFAPSFNGPVRALAVSANQKTLYVAGQFTKVNGATRSRVVAFDLASGKVVSAFVASANASVYGLAVTDSTVYLSGVFTSVNGVTTNGVAAVSTTRGAVRAFAVKPAGGSVRQVIVSPDTKLVVLGGSFTTMNGSTNPGYGLAMVNATTGAMLPLPINALLRNGTSKSAIMSLVATATGFYGTGYSFARAAGNVEGTFRADWSGKLVWYEDCHGDTYSVALSGDEVYIAGHPHYCGGVGAFPQTPVFTFHRALAFTTAATGVLGTDPLSYYNYAGKPAPSQLTWYPDINAGTYTGQSQGPWSVAASADYVVYGGEFSTVNRLAQQGLVRFARTALAPNTDGPRLGGGDTGLAVRSYGDSALRISWPANYDRDNEHLSYRLFRDDQLIYQTAADSTFYRRPLLSFLDPTVSAGHSYTYRLKAADPFGNSAWSGEVTGTPGDGTTLGRYQSLVLADGPQAYWSADETSGTAITDLAGSDQAVHGAAVQLGVAGAIDGEPGTAYRLTGSADTTMNDTVPEFSSDNFSTELWFKTTSSAGGQLVGFDSSTTGLSGIADRHVYLSDDGRVYFTVRPRKLVKSVSSNAGYADGAWHHMVATLSGRGMYLYLDGTQVGFSADTKSGMAFGTHTGFWRMGGDTLTGLPAKPTSSFLSGDLDEIAVYPVALTADQVRAHHALGATSG
jgi:hypothetical protein